MTNLSDGLLQLLQEERLVFPGLLQMDSKVFLWDTNFKESHLDALPQRLPAPDDDIGRQLLLLLVLQQVLLHAFQDLPSRKKGIKNLTEMFLPFCNTSCA